MPKIDDRVETPFGPGKVTSIDDRVDFVFRQPVRTRWYVVAIDGIDGLRWIAPAVVKLAK